MGQITLSVADKTFSGTEKAHSVPDQTHSIMDKTFSMPDQTLSMRPKTACSVRKTRAEVQERALKFERSACVPQAAFRVSRKTVPKAHASQFDHHRPMNAQERPSAGRVHCIALRERGLESAAGRRRKRSRYGHAES